MNISGTVRVDLSGYVDHQHLLVPDRCVGPVALRLAGAEDVEVYVGAARRVDWDPRLLDALVHAQRVRVVGDDFVSAERARHQLRLALDERIPGPRIAS